MNQIEQTLRQLLNERILILDGAMGTMIQTHKLGEKEFRGERFADHGKELMDCVMHNKSVQPFRSLQ